MESLLTQKPSINVSSGFITHLVPDNRIANRCGRAQYVEVFGFEYPPKSISAFQASFCNCLIRMQNCVK